MESEKSLKQMQQMNAEFTANMNAQMKQNNADLTATTASGSSFDSRFTSACVSRYGLSLCSSVLQLVPWL